MNFYKILTEMAEKLFGNGTGEELEDYLLRTGCTEEEVENFIKVLRKF